MIGELIESPFHPGERTAQLLAGSSPHGATIRDWMPDQHRAFFAALPFVLTATTDAAGWPVATVLAGAPGFSASPDPWTLRIAARRDAIATIRRHSGSSRRLRLPYSASTSRRGVATAPMA